MGTVRAHGDYSGVERCVNTPLVIIPDTNILLHFRLFVEVDWSAVTGEELVEVAISRVVLRELDERKINHQSAKIRDRARRIL